jgi:hypothetical protein
MSTATEAAILGYIIAHTPSKGAVDVGRHLAIFDVPLRRDWLTF